MLTSLLVTPAFAAPVWTPPERIAEDGHAATTAINSSGDSVALWARTTSMWTSFRHPGGSWLRAKAIPDVDSVAGDRGVVIDRHGNTTVAWYAEGMCQPEEFGTPYDVRDFEIHASYRPAGGTWRRQTIQGMWDGCSADTLELAVDRSGTVTAAWLGDGQIVVAQRTTGGGWTKPANIGAAASGPNAVVTGPEGTVTTMWRGAGSDLWAATSSVPGTWNSPRLIASGTGHFVTVPQIAADAEGNLLATTVVRSGTGPTYVEELTTIAKPTGGRWQDPETVASSTNSTDFGHFHNVVLAVNDSSDTLVWYQDEGNASDGRVMTSTRLRGGQWGIPTALSGLQAWEDATNETGWIKPAVAANNAGTVAVWNTSVGAETQLNAAYRKPGGGWSAPQVLDSLVRPDMIGAGPWESPLAIGHRSGMFTVLYLRNAALKFTDFVDDSVAPRVRMLQPAKSHALGDRMRVSWAALDALAGVRDFDVRVRSAGRGGQLSTWKTWLSRTTESAANRTVEPGRTYCFAARARDRVGNRSGWSAGRCSATPVDDRAAKVTAGWTRARNHAAYQQTLTSTDQFGQRLVLRGVSGHRISLVARTCSACGTVTVMHGARSLGSIDLSSALARNEQVFRLVTYPGIRAGKIVVRVTSRSKPVQIDGIIIKQ